MDHVTLTVPNISCEHCERTVMNALTPMAGVQRVAVNIPSHQVHVDFDATQLSVEEMAAALAAEDYPVESSIR